MPIAEGIPNSAARGEARYSRTLNPILYPLDLLANSTQHFSNTVNHVIEAYGGHPIEEPFSHGVRVDKNQVRTFVRTRIPLGSDIDKVRYGIRGLLNNHYQLRYAYGWGIPESRFLPWSKKIFCLSGEGSEYSDPNQVTGFLFRGQDNNQQLELRYDHDNPLTNFSEVEFGYLASVASLIVAGKIDLSSPEGINGSLGLRRDVFMDLYQTMLAGYQPPATREEIYGLDDQLADVERNLYTPLAKKAGNPMNTLLVGAPGVGKTLVARYEATRRDVVTVPVSVDELVHRFDFYILPRVKRLTAGLDLPVVLAVDDIERLLERAITVNEEGKPSQVIDPGERAKALTLLERMQDTHKVYLLATLNHPDVEAAYLRRFNPIYFPLPDEQQRQSMLQKIIDQGQLSNGEYKTLLEGITVRTVGFNYSGLSLIPQYSENVQLEDGVGQLDCAGYTAVLQEAVRKSGHRTSFKNLQEFDEAARRMIGLGSEF